MERKIFVIKMVGYVVIGLVVGYFILAWLMPGMPDWVRILWNAEPGYYREALDVAKRSFWAERRKRE